MLLGAGAQVADGATVGPRVVLGAGSRVEPGAEVRDSVLLDGCVVGENARVSGSILAAIAITLIQAMLLNLAEYHLLEFRMPGFALLLILTMIFRPSGLFGVLEIWDVWPFKRRRMN